MMTREQFIKRVEKLAEELLTEVDLSLHDLAREQTYYSLQGAIEHIKNNDEDERG